MPDATAIGYLVGTNGRANADTQAILTAASAKGRELIVIECGSMADVDAAFEQLSQRQAGSLIVGAFPLFTNNSNKVVALSGPPRVITTT